MAERGRAHGMARGSTRSTRCCAHQLVPSLFVDEWSDEEFAGQAASVLRDLPDYRSAADVRRTLAIAFAMGFGPPGLGVQDTELDDAAADLWRLLGPGR